MNYRWLAILLLAPLALPVLAQDGDVEAGRLGLRAGRLIVYYDPRDEQFATVVEKAGQKALPRLESALGLDQEAVAKAPPIRIDIARNNATFNHFAGSKMQPWVEGVALEGQRRIVIRTLARDALKTVTVHELTHVLLSQVSRRYGAQPPRWLHEGLAKFASDDFSEGDRQVLGQAAAANHLLNIAQVEAAFHGNLAQVQLAYAESYTLVRYLHELRPGGLDDFLRNLGLTGSVDRALLRTYGMPRSELEQKWLRQVRQQYLSQGVPLSVNLVIFGLMALFGTVAYFAQRRRRMIIRRRMQEEERLRGIFGYVDPEDENDEDAVPPYQDF